MSQSDALDMVRNLLGPQFRLIAGTSVHGEIPVSEVLVNRLIREQLERPDSGAPVSTARLDIHGTDEMTAHVTLRAPTFLPSIRVAIRIEQQPSFPDAPVLGLRWTLVGMGLLGRMAAPALTVFKALPPGVHLVGDRLLLDVRRLLESRGWGDLAGCVTTLNLRARSRTLVVRFEVRVPESTGGTVHGEDVLPHHVAGVETQGPDQS